MANQRQKSLGSIAREMWLSTINPSLRTWNKIAAAVVAEHERRKWQPIKTAPKSQEIVIVGMWKRGIWRWKATFFLQVAIDEGYTHWISVPEGPEVDR